MLHQLSKDLLYQVKLSKPYDTYLDQLKDISITDLKIQIKNDELKKAFWTNIYNALFIILKRDQRFDKPEIYNDKLIHIADKKFSLDDIEHGILRKFKYKYSFGYLRNLFIPRWIKSLDVDSLDYRIHFALNCGAKSCPPIAFYDSDKLEQQFQLAELSFLEGETAIDDLNKTVKTSMILNWYRGDFGGIGGIRTLLSRVLNKDLTDYSIGFKPYNWEEDLNNYQ